MARVTARVTARVMARVTEIKDTVTDMVAMEGLHTEHPMDRDTDRLTAMQTGTLHYTVKKVRDFPVPSRENTPGWRRENR